MASSVPFAILVGSSQRFMVERSIENKASTYKTISKAPWPMITFCVRSITPGRTVSEEGNEESPPTKTSPLAHSSHSILGALMAS